MKKYNTYQEATEFLYKQLPMYQRIGGAAYKANLDNTYKLDAKLGHPHKHFKSIHIAGTNGKGSASHMIASVLMECGYKVGLYTSPHLRDFKERIKINRSEISEEAVICFVNNNLEFIELIQPSFFEMTVAMALDHFAKNKVDVAVIEVGLGGRLDSTNIITPDLSVITNIGFDHTQYLGNTLENIAKEKAGIIKTNTPVIIGQTQPETIDIFHQIANDKNSVLIEAEEKYNIPYSTMTSERDQVFQVYKNNTLTYPNLELDLLGLYQQKNIKTVLTAFDELNKLHYNISEANIYKGLKNTKKNTNLLGRWHAIGYNPLIICDIAHNTDGIKEIVSQLKTTPYKQLHIVLGMVNDKNINEILALLPKEAIYYFTKANISRSLNEIELMNIAKNYSLIGQSYPNTIDALKNAKKNASPNDLIFIGGSTFVVSEVI